MADCHCTCKDIDVYCHSHVTCLMLHYRRNYSIHRSYVPKLTDGPVQYRVYQLFINCYEPTFNLPVGGPKNRVNDVYLCSLHVVSYCSDQVQTAQTIFRLTRF
jgi:hypothetical protein